MSRKSHRFTTFILFLAAFAGALWAILSFSTTLSLAESSYSSSDPATFLSAEEPDLDQLTFSSPRFRKSAQRDKAIPSRHATESPESEEATPCCKDATPAPLNDLRKLTEELGKTLNEVFLIGTPPATISRDKDKVE
ncbi:MAG: hypothetical protein HY391_05000 [Deltaproteobacteria bacterium]|nr:hypothetical protein [Deltaproteobacteria bacterium]